MLSAKTTVSLQQGSPGAYPLMNLSFQFASWASISYIGVPASAEAGRVSQ